MRRINFKEIESGKEKIGIDISSEEYTILIPKYLLSSQELNQLNKESKEKIKKLFKAWEIYQIRNKGELGATFTNENNIYDLNNSLEIIKDFIEHGLYIEQEDSTKITNTGKMDFKKTINNCNPLYTEQGPIYLEYITNTKKPNDQNFLRIVQTTVINEISEDFGWIICFNIKFPIHEKIQLNKKTRLILYQKLQQSFNSRKINLIKLLIKYIDMNSKGIKEGKKLFIGIANLFWEDMIDFVIGNVTKEELKKYFYIRHAYVEGTTTIQRLSALMPDSIYKDDLNIIVIDSKYYVNDGLPDNDDINKQIIYILKAYELFPNHENFGNCFVLPTDKKSHTSNKKVKFDEDVEDELLSINLIYANVNEIVHYYTNHKKNHYLLNDLTLSN